LIYDCRVNTAEIAQLLEPFIHLDEQRLFAISRYIDLLLKWNARINLTAVRAPEEMVQRHFGESFFAARHLLAEGTVERAIDLGSGAGFPGVPLALLAPGTTVTLIESNQKKATFLRELVRVLEIKSVEIFSGRGEEYSEQADLVTMRAVEKFGQALDVAVGLVKAGGRIALMIGAAQVSEAAKVLPKIGWRQPISVPGGHSRVLLAGIKGVKVE
jgi:16S rRNA (guanine527-N7)-methyltransferase